MNKNFRILVLSLLAGFAANAKLHAESYQWTGPASGSWNDPNNWTPSQVPGSGDAASIAGGSIAVVIDSSISITGLSVGGGSSLTVATGGVLNIRGDVALQGLLANEGTINWLAGDISVQKDHPSYAWYGYAGAIENRAGGLFDIRCDRTMNWPGSFYLLLPQFANAGTLRKSAEAGTTSISIAVNNTGTVEALAGTLALGGGGTLGGTFWAAEGAAVYFTGGSFDLSGTPDFHGPGQVGLSGSPALSGTLTGTFEFYGGTLAGGSNLTVATGGVLNIRSDVTLQGLLANEGTINWLAGDISVYKARPDYGYGYTGGIENRAGGLFDIRCDRTMSWPSYYYLSLPQFSNAGTVRKSEGTGTSSISIALANTGTVEALVGTILFGSGFTGTVSVTISVAGNLLGTDYGRIVFAQSPVFDGPFTLTLRNGFLPASGDSFDVLLYPTASGDFTRLVGLDLGNGLHLEPRFQGSGLSLVATMRPLEAIPKLMAVPTVSGIFIWWPVEYTKWELHRSIDLKTWEPASVTGTNMVVPAVLPKEFFRLQERP